MRTFVDDIATLATRDPHRVAVVGPTGSTAYGELIDRVERLAGGLRSRGAGPETVCAVAVDRADAVVATAAVIRSGAVFLGLDIEQPPARLAALARTGGARMLLTTADLAERLAGLPVPGPPVLLDDPAPPGERGVLTGPHGRNAAYVSHTSGSTGEPAPVLIEHRGLDAYLRSVVRDCRLGPDTVALQVAPQGYDASLRDTLAPLLAGGRVVVVPRAVLMRPAALGAAIRERGVNTLLSVTPSFLSFIAGQPDAADILAGVRLVASSGESLRPFLAAGGRGLVAGELINQYGPTECTMTSTRHAVPRVGEVGNDGTVRRRAGGGADVVGEPLDHVAVRLLDNDLVPVPDGATGEVFIGGPGVARGYRGQPSRTAECFVPDPLGPPGARLYRTGDLARRGPRGLEYLGRTDRQVKIRGYRVDPAEVEGTLLSHPGVTGAVVTADGDERGRVFLTAHVTGVPAGVEDAELRSHLLRTLPPHLMPRRFVRRDSLPTTRSGKIDRRALASSGGTS
ncbi:amino acid adenylation domain-containing protein [Streptomyces sp. ST2-7A]|uniref:amino acid adenylation domain-containing protein n=1 Tax=Streptomyces sp. ST2-7A TaxID=2907214 RepID=UPI001F1E7C46|nr:amino acid adenylation domain-containing protein [Streptomyces sp. ST2-7A]MCE7082317.1 amino acid adenylation domain-containing protein [Streptomyces sp. ST2-7A]